MSMVPCFPEITNPFVWCGFIADDASDAYSYVTTPLMTPIIGHFPKEAPTITGKANDLFGTEYNIDIHLNGTATATSVPVFINVTGNGKSTLPPILVITIKLSYAANFGSADQN